MSAARPVEVAWFGALCDDDYEYLGVPGPALASSWEHCRDITLAAEHNVGIDAFILSGYPHLDACNRVGREVLPRLEHGYLARPDSVLRRSLRREYGRDQ